MVDIHCHILPGVDDGAKTMEDALEMARMAAASGVTHLIATPHCNLPYSELKNYASPLLNQQFLQLRTQIQQADIPLSISLGAEVLCMPDVPQLIRKGSLPHLGTSDFLLVEFFFDEELSYMDNMLQAITAEGITPVVAHPERYEAIQQSPYILGRWFQDNYVIQLNKGSILGRLGRRAKTTAHWILDHGLAHVVASDAHSPHMRTPSMTQLYQHLLEYYDPEYVDILLNINPFHIFNGRPVLKPD